MVDLSLRDLLVVIIYVSAMWAVTSMLRRVYHQRLSGEITPCRREGTKGTSFGIIVLGINHLLVVGGKMIHSAIDDGPIDWVVVYLIGMLSAAGDMFLAIFMMAIIIRMYNESVDQRGQNGRAG